MKYEVKSGDSLSKIARSFNMDYKELARLNKIADPDKIRIGQVISIPTKDMKTQVENAQQQRPTTRGTTRRQARPEPKPEPKPEPRPEPKPEPKKSSLMEKPQRDPIIPTNVRQFVYDLFGGTETLTEKDLKKSEREALKEAALRAQRQGKKAIEYVDYGTQQKGESQYADVGGGGDALDFVSRVFDPSYSMKTTIGQARIEKDKEGNTIIVDRYNFNDADDKFSFTGLMAGVKRAGFSPYAQIRNIARELGSGQGEGSEVRINLGQLASTDIKKVEGLI
tara:strand:- start:60 stop:899 length:840 start_codon:yes stop_codon:yes gene_type:complete